jgi:hypothetical protein
LVDVFEWELVGDEPIEAHFPEVDESDKAGDFEIGGDAAAVGALEDFFEVKG